MQSDEWLERFKNAVRRPEREINVAEAALIIAADEYPALEVDKYLGRLDEIAEQAKPYVSESLSPRRQTEQLGDFMFRKLQFKGNADSYYDAQNSYLNDVIDRRLGIPITLSILYVEVGRRLGMPLFGVGFPGHFIVKWHSDDEEIFVDPFGDGRILDEFGLLQLAEAVIARGISLRREWLESVGPRYILSRLLANLKSIFLRGEDLHRAFLATQKLLVLLPFSQENLRDASMLSYRMGSLRHAAEYMEEFLLHHPDARDAGPMRVYLRSVWVALNRLS
jgi:regulator of sirC expression with transglutaminase-like and TPR domain